MGCVGCAFEGVMVHHTLDCCVVAPEMAGNLVRLVRMVVGDGGAAHCDDDGQNIGEYSGTLVFFPQ